MRVFLAGGSGVIGRRLIPSLAAAGHEVVATTRRPESVDDLRSLGATGVVADAYDAPGLAAAVADAAPDVVLHELTDLAEYDTDANARLRREGTANLVAAARAAGVERMIVQSIAWVFPDADAPATEDDPIVPGTAVDDMERLVRSLPHAAVLRYGMLYGPGTWYAPGGRMALAVAAGRLPATPAITAFVHIDDVVTATVQSLEWPDGVYHVVDDEPAPGTVWLPAYAASIGAPPPPVGPLPDGAPRGRLISNAKARAAGWTPRFPSWRTGFRTVEGVG
jgi:nucleoside-diphosphate-sugar epimerase